MRRNSQVTFDAKKTGAGMTRILFGGCQSQLGSYRAKNTSTTVKN